VGWVNDIIRCFREIRLDRDSGFIAWTDRVTEDRLRVLRRWNFLEAWAVFALMMAVVWCDYWLDGPIMWRFRLVLGIPTILWAFVLSPLVHYYWEGNVFVPPHRRALGWRYFYWECRGLGDPVAYYLPRNGEPPAVLRYWREVLTVIAMMTALYASAAVTFSSEIDARYASWYPTFGGKIPFLIVLILALDALWLFVGIPFMVRLDNFRNALRFIAAFLLGALVMILVFNGIFQVLLEPFRDALKSWHFLSLRGPVARERLAVLSDPLAIGGQWAGYVTWGWVQQFIFTSYFATLFARSFPIERSRSELLKACLCSAFVFGMIHLPNVWLMLFTFLGGLLGGILYYQMTNLFALGFSHGFAGSLLNKLTPINFSVGPDQMPRR